MWLLVLTAVGEGGERERTGRTCGILKGLLERGIGN